MDPPDIADSDWRYRVLDWHTLLVEFRADGTWTTRGGRPGNWFGILEGSPQAIGASIVRELGLPTAPAPPSTTPDGPARAPVLRRHRRGLASPRRFPGCRTYPPTCADCPMPALPLGEDAPMTMDHRYFTLTRSGAVFRMDIDDDAETLDTFILRADGWTEDDRLMGYLLQGDIDLEELAPQDTADLIPPAFMP